MNYDLTRYFIVDRFGAPTSTYPLKQRHRADIESRRLNGPLSDHVIGVSGRRPFRVITLTPANEGGDEE